MKDKHTPGPWHVERDNGIYAKDQYIGLSLKGFTYDKGLPYKANAKLMAASPEMYELIPKLINLLGSWAYIIDQVGAYDTSESWDLADKWIDIRLKIEGDERP